VTTEIKKCTCIHVAQDDIFGKGYRVHNQSLRDRVVKWRCTVCGDVKEGGQIPSATLGKVPDKIEGFDA